MGEEKRFERDPKRDKRKGHGEGPSNFFMKYWLKEVIVRPADNDFISL
jgi:hypothetical protein